MSFFRRNRRASLDVSLLALIVAAAGLSMVPVQPVSALVILLAMCIVPGAAFLTRAGTTDPLTNVALAVGLSLAADTAVATVLAYSGWWHPGLAAAVVAAAAAALLVSDLLRTLTGSRPRPIS